MKEITRKVAYTPGEVAQVTTLSGTTIRRLIDNKTLECWRVPNSKHRRIPHDALIAFLTEHNMPIPSELQ